MTTYRFSITFNPELDEDLQITGKYFITFKTDREFKDMCSSLDMLMENDPPFISYGFSRMKSKDNKNDLDKFYRDFAVNILKIPNI